MTHKTIAVAFCLSAAPALCAQTQRASRAVTETNWISMQVRDAERRVDVYVNGTPFTSYIYPVSLKKPVLFPIRAADGTIVTRGYPLEPRPGERVDHPHHAGLWFNYGNVNGLDFWNNSTAIPDSAAARMGTIIHRKVLSTKDGPEGHLDVSSDWVDYKGTVILQEHTQFVFRAGTNSRTIDRITTLTAPGHDVSFTDNKEGVIGLRVARGLEQPSTTPETFLDASGRATSVPVLDNTGVTGNYTSSEGKQGDAVWGTRGRWTMLTGSIGNDPITIAMLDHPQNVGYPTFWHARGYGLFAANNFGQKALSNGKNELNYILKANNSVTMRHEIVILNGTASPADIEAYWGDFSARRPPVE
jgi:hypothetical protein